MAEFWKIFFAALLASVKFLFVAPVFIVQQKYNFIESFAFCFLSGMLGVTIFTFASEYLIIAWDWVMKKLKLSKPKKSFTKGNRKIVKFKKKFGLNGLAYFAFVPISIPLACFIAVRFYKNKNLIFKKFLIGVTIWSIIFSLFASAIIKLINYFTSIMHV